MKIGYTPRLNLINQLVSGPSWVSGQELIWRQKNKKNQLSDSLPGPIDQGLALEKKKNKHCPHCYTNTTTFWKVQLWIMQTFEGLEDSEPQIRHPTQWYCLQKATSRKTWLHGVLAQNIPLDAQEMSRRDPVRKAMVLHQPEKCVSSYLPGLIWNRYGPANIKVTKDERFSL